MMHPDVRLHQTDDGRWHVYVKQLGRWQHYRTRSGRARAHRHEATARWEAARASKWRYRQDARARMFKAESEEISRNLESG